MQMSTFIFLAPQLCCMADASAKLCTPDFLYIMESKLVKPLPMIPCDMLMLTSLYSTFCFSIVKCRASCHVDFTVTVRNSQFKLFGFMCVPDLHLLFCVFLCTTYGICRILSGQYQELASLKIFVRLPYKIHMYILYIHISNTLFSQV